MTRERPSFLLMYEHVIYMNSVSSAVPGAKCKIGLLSVSASQFCGSLFRRASLKVIIEFHKLFKMPHTLLFVYMYDHGYKRNTEFIICPCV